MTTRFRVIRDAPEISEKARKRVLKVTTELNYIKNNIGARCGATTVD